MPWSTADLVPETGLVVVVEDRNRFYGLNILNANIANYSCKAVVLQKVTEW